MQVGGFDVEGVEVGVWGLGSRLQGTACRRQRLTKAVDGALLSLEDLAQLTQFGV